MSVTRRMYVSLPADHWLPKELNDLKWAIVEEIENLGYTPEIHNAKGEAGPCFLESMGCPRCGRSGSALRRNSNHRHGALGF